MVQCDYCKKMYEQPYNVYYKSIKNNTKKACSNCQNIKQRDVIQEKYGVANISQLKETQEKIKENNLRKYGVTNTSKLDSTKEKVKESNRSKYGVDYPMQTQAFKDNLKNTSLSKYGVEYHVLAPEVIAKKYQTNIEKYGYKFPIQNKEILQKSIKSRYEHGNFSCSSQQYQLYSTIGGELNFPFKNFVIDIAFTESKIAVEWDGSGHDLSVRMGHISEKEFIRNENFRMNQLFQEDWKIIRFITKKDIYPNNIKDIFEYCINYIKNGGHKIFVLIDENKIHYKDKYIDFTEITQK